jgi:hypothetical protein
MRLIFLATALAVLTACAPPAQVSMNRAEGQSGVGFGPIGGVPDAGAGPAATPLSRDFMDLTFAMESGRALQTFTRFEGPISVALQGDVPATAPGDLDALVARLRAEAGIDITVTTGPAAITIDFIPRDALRRLAPQAACFVAPNVGSLAEYRRLRGSAAVDWGRITRRDRAAIFIPADTSPQEVRDCLHEELAQALGPLNDLYRLSDSVFNDDNFHTVLTGFDMQILALTYDARIASGMTAHEVGTRLFGQTAAPVVTAPGAWTQAIETALGRQGSLAARQAAADRALALATSSGWTDARAAFSHFAVGRLAAGSDPARALEAFDRAAAIYARLPGGAVQLAHVDMQRAAMALAGGFDDQVIRLADRAIAGIPGRDNAALSATLMLIKAEALQRRGNPGAAAALRLEAAGFARYGFGPEGVIRARMRDIAAVANRAGAG